MKLYEIGAELMAIEQVYDTYAQEHEGDVTDFPFTNQHDKLIDSRNDKLLNLGSWYKSVNAEVDAYATEIKTLQYKKTVAGNKLQWIKDFINSYIKEGERIKDSRVSLSWRKSEAIIVNDKLDMRRIPDLLKTVVVSLNKTEAKKAIKAGDKIEGVVLINKVNLQIK